MDFQTISEVEGHCTVRRMLEGEDERMEAAELGTDEVLA